MMRLILIIISLMIAVAIGIGLHQYPGLVVITVGGWRVDMPLWFPIAAIILFALVFYFMAQIITFLCHSLSIFQKWVQGYRLNRAKKKTADGYLALTLGEYDQAIKLLKKGASKSELPWLNYLAAAKAAQADGRMQERDACLEKAAICLPSNETAVKMAACEFALESGDWDKTLKLLKSLEKQLPHHPHVVLLLKNAYLGQKNWTALKELLPKIKQMDLMTSAEYGALEEEVWHGLFVKNHQADLQTLKKLWQDLPRRLQNDPDFILLYGQLMIRHQQSLEVEKMLVNALSSHWDEELIKLYGKVHFHDPKKALATAERWLSSHEDSPGLLLALGQICDSLDLWEKAQKYYEASLSMAPTPQTLTALGKHWERLNRPDLGGEYFKKALAMTFPSSFNDH